MVACSYDVYFTCQNAVRVHGLLVVSFTLAVFVTRWCEECSDMSCSHLALSNTVYHGGKVSSGGEGHVGGVRSAPVQRHVAAYLAAAADGA